jgi:glycosyltransferase involved in cell wall biosynthesis
LKHSKQMRVLIDGRMLLGRFSGVARVVTKLVEHLANRADTMPVVLCGNEPYLPWCDRDDIEMLVTDFRRIDRSPFRRLLWEETKLAGWISRSKADVYHATWNSGVPSGVSIPRVLTIHDLIPWSKPTGGLRGWVHRGCYRRSVSSSARRATVVTAVSDFSREDICQTLGLNRTDVLTVRNGVSLPVVASRFESEAHGTESGLSGVYVLYVGGHEPRKNLASVFRAMRTYWRDYGKGLTLALTGTTDALCEDAREAFESLPSGSAVRFLGFPSDLELGLLYRRARVLLMLSTNEGFGLPVLEAMAHGCPVIAANRASLPEVVGEAGVLVDPADADGVAGGIHRLESEAKFRSSIVAAGLERVNRFTWEATCEGMTQAYESACQNVSEAFPPAAYDSLATHNPG